MIPIRDSRHMHGSNVHNAAETIEGSWRAHAQSMISLRGGFENRTPADGLDQADDALEPYVSDNRWVADCPCGGGVACWPEMHRSCCYDCGTIRPVHWPSPGELRKLEAVLHARPPANRHWRGETIETLKVENLVNGYVPS